MVHVSLGSGLATFRLTSRRRHDIAGQIQAELMLVGVRLRKLCCPQLALALPQFDPRNQGSRIGDWERGSEPD